MPNLRILKGILLWKIQFLTLNLVLATVSVLGVAGFCFCLGAAVMFFHLPTSDFFHEAFAGAQALQQRGRCEEPSGAAYTGPQVNRISVDIPNKTQDGFTLYTSTHGSWAALIDMKGTVVHHWFMPFSEVRSHMNEISNPLPNKQIHWFGCRLFANGDLLAVYHSDGDTPYGYGLVKLDKDSRLLWAYGGRVHHEVDVGEDGSIYCIKHRFIDESPRGMPCVVAPYLADDVVVLSPEGKELHSFSLLDAFRDSKYASTAQMNLADAASRLESRGDYIHPNRIMVLGASLAPKFPLFQAGQVLISMRNIDLLAVLDISKRTVVWAAQGAWRGQHAAEFLANGHLLVYDNNGAGSQTRVLEYDPATQAVPWCYANENSQQFLAPRRGTSQRLANGNTLIVHPSQCRIFEVTPDKEVVWESFCREPVVKDTPDVRDGAVITINSARRYRADQVGFLKGVIHARP